MAKLLLLRHAKSSWDDSSLDDANRPLAPRGIAAAKAMGRWLATAGLIPDLVLCSTACRARETWAIAAAELHPAPPVQHVPQLYDFGDGEALLDVIRSMGGTAQGLMLVGHNPAMENLAARLVVEGDRELRSRMAAKFPTAALAVIDCPLSRWSGLTGGVGSLLHFIRPRDLASSLEA